MEKEKQVEEMAILARVFCQTIEGGGCCEKCAKCEEYKMVERLYNAGYRKEIQGEWISVEDRLPEKDGMYLIFSPYTNKEGGIVYCNRFLTKGNPIFSPNSFESLSKVTHWMPLPTLPQMKGVE